MVLGLTRAALRWYKARTRHRAFGSNLKVSDYKQAGVPLIFVRNIRSESFPGKDPKFVSRKKAEGLSAHQVIGGDLLITKMGDPPGDACIYPEEAPTAIITADCIRLHLPRTLEQTKQFFVYCINSLVGREQFQRITSGVAQQKVSLSRFAGIALSLPPLAEQKAIIREVARRLAAADRLAETLDHQLDRCRLTRQSLLRDAFAGKLVAQDPTDESATVLLERIRAAREATEAHQKRDFRRPPQASKILTTDLMNDAPSSSENLSSAWQRIDRKTDAHRLFRAMGLPPENVVQFYERLRLTPAAVAAFQAAAKQKRKPEKRVRHRPSAKAAEDGLFRLIDLWLEDFKNLVDYSVRFDPAQGLDVILGWNGTGKSNLFEALVVIFRDLDDWRERNRWPKKPMKGFRLSYEVDQYVVQITWMPSQMRRPQLSAGRIARNSERNITLSPIKREQLRLPHFVFGYYSGPTNRLAEHFLPMKQAHYARLRETKTDDPATMARLLRQRRFFCAETHHAKYVLLAFSYKEDATMRTFLEQKLRIVGFESALFIIRKPRWARRGSTPADFWGATGVMRRVMERLRRYAIAPLVLQQNVSYGYRSTAEDHYYFFLPDLATLQSFAAEYADARTFFLALESTDFSELIHDVVIQVRVKATRAEDVSITFHQLSEGEQQLLTVLGLLRFTKANQSLVLLDEPDTHLNPHWSVDYLRDLHWIMRANGARSPEEHTSQILMATHDPLVIASLVKEQVHLLKRDFRTGACKWEPASVNPRGLGFTGILTSDMFGFRSDLDRETLADLDDRVRLIAKEDELTVSERQTLGGIDKG
jgi:predicted ATPase